MLRKELCMLGMGQRSNYAAKKDVQIMSSKEECVLGMAKIKSSKEESASDMGHIAIQTMNLLYLYLDQNTVSLLQLNPSPTSMLLKLPS